MAGLEEPGEGWGLQFWAATLQRRPEMGRGSGAFRTQRVTDGAATWVAGVWVARALWYSLKSRTVKTPAWGHTAQRL